MFWTEQSTRWYKEAAEYTKYYRDIYREIAPFIDETDSVCDIGCGLGYVSVELAQKARRVTASDVADRPLLELEKMIKQQHIENLSILHIDWSELSKEPKWDVVVSSFFKSKPEEMGKLMEICEKRAIIVVSNGSEDSFLPGERTKHYKKKADVLSKGLYAMGIPFVDKELTLQFGQPLSSKEEAAEFIHYYLPDSTESEKADHISQHLQRIEADSYGNEYFFSNNKEIGIFIVEKSDFEKAASTI